MEDKEEALRVAQSEVRQARKDVKALKQEKRELSAARHAAELKVEALESEKEALQTDQADLRKISKQLEEKNELLTKQLKAEKRLARQRGTRARMDRAAEACAEDPSPSSPTEESDAIRALHAQLDSVSRQVGLRFGTRGVVDLARCFAADWWWVVGGWCRLSGLLSDSSLTSDACLQRLRLLPSCM